jgi:hypothetical protein
MTAPSAGESRPLTLDQLLLELAREPVGSLAHARLMELASRLTLDEELIERRTAFEPDAYARNLVCRTPDVELLVLCWRSGQSTAIHDHAGSLNAIRVHRGELTSRLYTRAATAVPGRGPVELASEELVPAGALTGLDRDGIHQLVNLSDQDLVTIHLYAPPLKVVTLYSTADDAVECLPLRYTMADDIA